MADSQEQAQRPRPSLLRRFLSVPTVISFVMVGAVVALLATQFEVDWGRTGEVIRHSNPVWVALAVAVHYTTFLFRGARWRLLLANAARDDDPPQQPPSTLYCGAIILISWFANLVTWFRLGDAYRAYAYAEDTRTGFSRTMGTVLADRVVDLGVVLAIMAGSAAALYVSGTVRPSPLFLGAAAAVLVAVFAGLLGMYLLRRWVAPRLPKQLEGAYHRFHAGTMGSFRQLHWVFLLGVLGWLAEVGRLFCVLNALDITVAPGLVFFVPMANGLLSALPLTPGGLGIVETGITGLLMLEIAREEAVAVALLDRSISYASVVVTGGIAFAIRQARVGKRAAGRTQATPAS